MVDQRQALLHAIIADPDDDAVRLVYADWLEEHGAAADRDRAQLIRLQIELEQVEDDARRSAILSECEGLIDRNWQEWSHSFQTEKTGAGYYKATYKRGFLPRMCLDDEDLTDSALDVLLAHEPITKFFMRRIDGFPDAVARWKHLPRIRELSFSGGGDNVKSLLRSPLLTGLQIFEGSNALDEEDVALIASDPRFAGLSRLEIGFNDLPDRAVAVIAQSQTLSNLTAFSFSGTPTTIAALEALAGSPLAGRLTFVGLRQYDWSGTPRFGKRAAELLAGFRRLEGIDLHGQRIGDDGAEVLAGAASLANLKNLEIGQNELGLRGLTAILASPYLGGVEELDLSDNRPGGAWIVALASAGPRRLRRLTIQDNDLDWRAAVLLADAMAVEGVRELSLRGNPIGDQGAIALAGSTHLTQLRNLGLGSCNIGDVGASALAGSETLRRLEGYGGLGLSGNAYGDNAARQLRQRFGYDPSSY